MTDPDRITGHYASTGIVERIRAALGPGTPVTPDTLAAMDHFHGRGLAATEEMVRLLDPQPGERILDIGSGIGGPARWIAYHYRCDVTGIDLTAEFCAAARALGDLTGQSARVEFVEGSALDMPFADASFERAYSQNVVMNIADKRAFYAEAYRVLKPGGVLVLSNLCEGENGPPYYPAPWADTPATSFLATVEETRADIGASGFEILSLEDTTPRTRPNVTRMLEKFEAGGFPAQNVHVALGDHIRDYQLNSMRSTRDGRLRTIEALVRRPVDAP